MAMVVTSAIFALSAAASGTAPGTVTTPPAVQAPLPVEPLRVKEVAPVLVMVNVPLAAVFPCTRLIVT